MRLLRSELVEAAQGYIKSEWNVPDRLTTHYSGGFRADHHKFSHITVGRYSRVKPAYSAQIAKVYGKTPQIAPSELVKQVLPNQIG